MPSGGFTKQRHIEALRGLACLLLVAYHVIGNDAGHGMHVAETSGWRLFTEIFMHVRMPLFFFISGYVFSAFVGSRAEFSAAVLKKLRRIGIPLVVVSSLFYLSLGYGGGSYVPGGQVPLWQIYVLPYEHYWYLQATLLIMIFLLACGLAAGRHLRAVMTVLLPLSAFVFVLSLTFDPDIFSLGSALYLLPYFLLGNLLKLWSAEERLDATGWLRSALLIGLGGVLVLMFVLELRALGHENTLDFARQSALGLVFGFAACLFLFLLRPRSRTLEFIGYYSYSIYLFHVFCTAAFRRAIAAMAPGTPQVAFFVAAVSIGIGLPILLHLLAIRHRVSALLLLGIELKPGERAAKPAGGRADQHLGMQPR